MRFQSGKHEGKIGEVVLLKAPDWVEALMKHQDNKWCAEFNRLIAKFDKKSFVEKCKHCGKQATRASAYQNTSDLMFCCDSCDLYDSGARPGTLSEVRTFASALRHVDYTCTAPRTEKRDIILALARGKGLPKRITEEAAIAFFG